MLIETGRAERPESTWGQLAQDFLTPAGRSNWNRNVVDKRILFYDRARPFASRGVLVVAQAALMAYGTTTSLLTWLLLVPALVQVTLEIALEPRVRYKNLSEATEEGSAAANVAATIWYRNYEQIAINVTGLSGIFSVAGVLSSVLLASGSATPAWARVAAFACATLFSVSALLSLMLHTPWFSPLQHPMMARLSWLRPHVWLVALAVLWCSLWISNEVEPWPGDSLTYAVGASFLGYYIGLRMRDVDREMGSSAAVATDFEDAEQKFIAEEMHNKVQWVKQELDEVLASPVLTTAQRVAMSQFIYDVRELHDQSRTRQVAGAMLVGTIEDRARAIAREISMRVEFDVQLSLADIGSENYRFARELATTLVYNARQAYERHSFSDDWSPRPVVLDVSFVRNGDVVELTVSDSLDPIPPGQWLTPGSTLAHYAERLNELRGDLVQQPGGGGKSIVATWDLRLMPLRTLE